MANYFSPQAAAEYLGVNRPKKSRQKKSFAPAQSLTVNGSAPDTIITPVPADSVHTFKFEDANTSSRPGRSKPVKLSVIQAVPAPRFTQVHRTRRGSGSTRRSDR